MSDYAFPPPLRALLDSIEQSTPEKLMVEHVRPAVAMMIGALINNTHIGHSELAVAFTVGLGTVMAISRAEEGKTPMEEQTGIQLTDEDILQSHFVMLRHIFNAMSVDVKAERMDMVSQQTTPKRTM